MKSNSIRVNFDSFRFIEELQNERRQPSHGCFYYFRRIGSEKIKQSVYWFCGVCNQDRLGKIRNGVSQFKNHQRSTHKNQMRFFAFTWYFWAQWWWLDPRPYQLVFFVENYIASSTTLCIKIECTYMMYGHFLANYGSFVGSISFCFVRIWQMLFRDRLIIIIIRRWAWWQRWWLSDATAQRAIPSCAIICPNLCICAAIFFLIRSVCVVEWKGKENETKLI